MKAFNSKKQFLYKPYKDGVIITKCVLQEEKIVIPMKIDGKKVKAIGHDAFIYKYEETEQMPLKVKEIHIPSTVKYISNNAFGAGKYYFGCMFCNENAGFCVDPKNKYYCSENGVLYNKDKTKLIQYPMGKRDKHFIVPDSVTNISPNAFLFARIHEISIPKSVVSLGRSAFQFCFNLRNIDIKNVKIIPKSCFYECHRLKNVDVGNNLKIIERDAFVGCNIESIKLPKKMKKIGKQAFSCSCIKNIIIPHGLKKIPNGVFSGCKIEKIVIPEGVKKIGKYAFDGCSNLKEVILPNGLLCIMEGAFMRCKPFENIIIPKSVKKIDSYAFADTYLRDATVYDETTVDKLAFCIGSYDSLDAKEIYISKNVKYISPYAFLPYYYDIEKFVVDPENKNYFSKDGVIYSNVFAKYAVMLVKYPINKGNTRFIIHKNVYSILKNAFYGNRNLENIIINEGEFRYISEGAFKECKNLEYIELPKCLKGVGDHAFAHCNKLKNFVLPDNISKENII